MTYIGPMREGGRYCREAFVSMDRDLQTVNVMTVYADKGEPSHSVRLWYHADEPGARKL